MIVREEMSGAEDYLEQLSGIKRDGDQLYKEKFMTEPFEIYIDGEMLTVIPQDETYIVYKGMSKLGDIMPHQDDEGLVWVTGDLIPLDYLAQIGEQIELSRPR